MSHDITADAINQIMNCKRSRKKELVVTRSSKFLLSLLELIKKEGYIEDYALDGRKITIKIGKLNKCNAIKPRFTVTVDEIEKYIRRYLPSRDFGIIIISTSSGLMTHKEAYEKNIGGSLIAYFY